MAERSARAAPAVGGPLRRPPRYGAERTTPYGRTPQVASTSTSLTVGTDGGNRIMSSNDYSSLENIERLIRQRVFSRDESDHLITLMRLRTPDICNTQSTTLVGRISNATPLQEDVGPSTKASDFSLLDDVGSSPIDIAKAFMGTRSPSCSYDPRSRRYGLRSTSVGNVTKALFSSATRSPVCWPGAEVHEKQSYHTPDLINAKNDSSAYSGSTLIHSLFSKPASKMSMDKNFSHVAQKTAASISLEKNISSQQESSVNLKKLTESRKDVPFKAASKSNFQSYCDISHGAPGVSPVHPMSRKAAQKILSHLERPLESSMASIRKDAMAANASFAASAIKRKMQEEEVATCPKPNSQFGENVGSEKHSGLDKVLGMSRLSNTSEGAMHPNEKKANSKVNEVPNLSHNILTESACAAALAERIVNNGTAASPGFGAPAALSKFPTPPTSSLDTPPSIPPELGDIPVFSFPSAKGRNALNFSLGLPDKSEVDITVPCFKFGTGGPHRLSFNISGKAIC